MVTCDKCKKEINPIEATKIRMMVSHFFKADLHNSVVVCGTCAKEITRDFVKSINWREKLR